MNWFHFNIDPLLRFYLFHLRNSLLSEHNLHRNSEAFLNYLIKMETNKKKITIWDSWYKGQYWNNSFSLKITIQINAEHLKQLGRLTLRRGLNHIWRASNKVLLSFIHLLDRSSLSQIQTTKKMLFSFSLLHSSCIDLAFRHPWTQENAFGTWRMGLQNSSTLSSIKTEISLTTLWLLAKSLWMCNWYALSSARS